MNNILLIKDFIYEIGLFIITTLGVYLVYKKDLDLINLVTFNSLILYLFEPVKGIVDLIPKYNYLKASFNKLSEFISVDLEKENEFGLKVIDNAAIKFRNVSYSYNKFNNTLEKVNLNIENHDKVLLVGPSGSGKSTICKLLFRYLTSYNGDIEFSITSEKDYSLSAIRNDILYVGQNEKLFTGSIRDNILCFRDITEEEFLKVSQICKLEEIVSKKKNRYNTIINASLNNLSGGEKQRIILARGLLKPAKLLILDEALSEVNETMEKEILNNIFKYYKEKTLIYVTHKNVKDIFNKIIDLGEKNARNI